MYSLVLEPMRFAFMPRQRKASQLNILTSIHCIPFVNKTKTYPVGHPEIFTHPADQNTAHYFGIAKVELLPPSEPLSPSAFCARERQVNISSM